MENKLLLVPFAGGSLGKNVGTSLAPNAIVEALKSRDSLAEIGSRISFSEVLVPVIKDDFPETQKIVEQFSNGGFRVAIGGDHSITYSLFKGFASSKKNPGIVIFDAHADCMQSFQPVTHENYLRCLVEENILKSENIVLVSTRTLDVEELNFLSRHHIKIFSMIEISREGLRYVCDAIMSIARSWSDAYISIDIDSLDPAFAPGTGYPEPGGLSTRDLLYCVQRLKLIRTVSCWDVVEVDGSHAQTVSVGAKIVSEIL